MSGTIERLQRADYVMLKDGFHSKTLANEAADTITRLQAELSALRASAKEARAEALEEAAKVAETTGRPVGASDGRTYIPGTSAEAAAAIRRLKEGK